MFIAAITVILALVRASAGDDEVCCKNLGCYSMTYPWVTSTRQLPEPQCPPELIVDFYLFNSENPSENYTIKAWPDIELDASKYIANTTTMLFIHDLASSATDNLVQQIKDAYLQRFDAYVILVDWVDNSNGTYPEAVSNSRVIASQIARLVKYLIFKMATSPETLHIIGHGIGAHTAGLVGKVVPGISRISGLDPTSPYFDNESRQVRLDTADAQFVDVSHTNGHPVTGIGTSNSLGHVDFFINSGLTQPACPIVQYGEKVTQMIKGNFTAFYEKPDPQDFQCSHNLVVTYFSQALGKNNCTYWGVRRTFWRFLVNVFSFGLFSTFVTPLRRCNVHTCTPFGLNTSQYPARGSFDLATSDTEPYCIKHKDVDILMRKKLKEYEDMITSLHDVSTTESTEISTNETVQETVPVTEDLKSSTTGTQTSPSAKDFT